MKKIVFLLLFPVLLSNTSESQELNTIISEYQTTIGANNDMEKLVQIFENEL